LGWFAPKPQDILLDLIFALVFTDSFAGFNVTTPVNHSWTGSSSPYHFVGEISNHSWTGNSSPYHFVEKNIILSEKRQIFASFVAASLTTDYNYTYS